jgi:hypothetical protein
MNLLTLDVMMMLIVFLLFALMRSSHRTCTTAGAEPMAWVKHRCVVTGSGP